ncbi:uncharacterized protein LOC114579474 [Dendrobium catenatum]|uniref:uncharacterized protein LOC114579474 n=1 Tax=Dendrobium catenatum TaxID=906689 RepID=UPI00109F383F|nr:uncharacterized protein LOC114579474 [Dendrobium catenatum]
MKEIAKDFGVFFIGLLETKITSFERKEVDLLIDTEWNFYCVPSEGLSGGILVLWKVNVASFQILESSSQLIVGDLEVHNKGTMRIASIYGSNDVYRRRWLWERLEFFADKELPIVIGGDFNCILSSDDKRGGKRFQLSLESKEMKTFLANNDFHEVGFVGPKFTWCNNKQGADRILERLDKMFYKFSCYDSLKSPLCKALGTCSFRSLSDHLEPYGTSS